MAGIDSNTVLCVHCDGADGSSVFTDSSQYNHSLSRTGIKVDTDQSMFGGSSALFQKVIGNSITTPDSADWNFGSGDFTIDLWVMFSSASGNQCLIAQAGSSNAAWQLALLGGSNKLEFLYYTSGGSHSCTVNWSPSLNTWYHVAVVRSGTSLKLYINGANVSSGGFDMTGVTIRDSPNALLIGETNANSMPLDGWQDEIRISKGVARWTADFTPPTAAYSPGTAGTYDDHPSGGLVLGGSSVSTTSAVGIGGLDANCVLLLHADGADGSTLFPDASSHNHVMSRAQVKVRTDQSQFGGASASFPGTTGQWITTPDSPDWYFAAGDFTIDLWMRFNATADQVLIGQWDVSAGNGGWYLMYTAGGTLQFTYRDSTNSVFSVTRGIPGGAAVGLWYHFAVVRSGGVIRLYINGSQMGGDYAIGAASLYDSPNALNIGSFTGTGATPANGWMDEIRISKVARWTAPFNPPTGPYTPSFDTTYNDAQSGGIALGGSISTVRQSDFTPSGGVVLGGAQTISYTRASTPSGGIRLGGSTIIGPAKLTVRLMSGGVEIASWQHGLVGNQARVSWAQFQVPLSAAAVVRVTPGKAKLRLKAEHATLTFRYTLLFRAAKLLLKAKQMDTVDPSHLVVHKPRLRLKGKTSTLALTQRIVVQKSKLILNAHPVARAGQPGLIPTTPVDVPILTPTTPEVEILVPTAAKSTLLKPTAVRAI